MSLTVDIEEEGLTEWVFIVVGVGVGEKVELVDVIIMLDEEVTCECLVGVKEVEPPDGIEIYGGAGGVVTC
ncbi:hypothetical protein HMI54_000603 [Coelomomyces lativittatus]|nr:hypothetical protein HMI54_000603 [Coelomomyces lativittatus]